MLKRTLLIVLGIFLLAAVGFGFLRLFSRQEPAPPEGTLAPGEQNEEPLLTGEKTDDAEPPLFVATPSTTLPGGTQSGTRALAAHAVCPTSWAGKEDADGDGLPNETEQIYGTDDRKTDTDGDSHTDGDEVKNGYDPARPGGARLDRDADGLLEHEECRWTTDPTLPDTDGDGFRDGDEVKNGFDPTVVGDGRGSDALPTRKAGEAEQALTKLRPNPNSQNYTEGLAGILLGNRPASEAGQIRVTPERVQEILNAARLDTALPDVAVRDLKPQPTNTAADIRAYLAALDTVRPPDLASSTNLTNALTRAFNGQTGDLREVRTSIQTYEGALLRISVPASAVDHHRLHISLIRYVNDRLGDIETASGGTAPDPVRAYIKAREIQEGVPPHLNRLRALRGTLEVLASQASAAP